MANVNATKQQKQPVGPVLIGDPLVQRAWRCAYALSWRWPLFLPALQHVTFYTLAEADPCQTACVDTRGRIGLAPAFAATLDDAELACLVAHELSHLIYRHSERRDGREPKAWNVACDMALNQILVDAGMRLPEGGLLPKPEWHDWPAEQIFDHLPRQQGEGDGEGEGEGEGGGSPRAMQGCGPTQAKGTDGDGTDGEGQGEGQGGTSDEQKWREVAAACAVMHNSSSRSDGGGTALSRLFDVPQPRVRWDKILRHGLHQALASHGRDDQTWSRRSRRSTPNVILPGWQALRAKVCVWVDNSGSVSDRDLSVAVQRVWEICKDVQGVQVFLVVHDHVVRHAGWINARTPVPTIRDHANKGRGGTVFEVAHTRTAEEKCHFDWAVHLTDGECPWPSPTLPRNVRKLVVALVGTRCRQYLPKEDARIRVLDARID
jgi:predicted metal-dependent peptidase